MSATTANDLIPRRQDQRSLEEEPQQTAPLNYPLELRRLTGLLCRRFVHTYQLLVHRSAKNPDVINLGAHHISVGSMTSSARTSNDWINSASFPDYLPTR